MSEHQFITATFPPAPVADAAVGIPNPQNEDITETAGYKEAMEDVKHGRVYHAESVDDMFNQILG